MILEYTSRGYPFVTFKDSHGKDCSIQESWEIGAFIWLGVDTVAGEPARMHLTINMVKELLPFLQDFVDTGSIEGACV